MIFFPPETSSFLQEGRTFARRVGGAAVLAVLMVYRDRRASARDAASDVDKLSRVDAAIDKIALGLAAEVTGDK